MNIVTERVSSIESLKSLGSIETVNSLLPSINELIELSKIQNSEPFVYHATDNKKIYAAAVFIFERRQIHKVNLNTFSLLGHDYFDYNFFFCDDEIFHEFLNFIALDAKKQHADAIFLENIILDKQKTNLFRRENVNHFNANLALEKFNYILQKKSLIRHRNKAIRSFNYSCEHNVATFKDEDIALLSKLHQERWCFDEIKSAFCETKRSELYFSYKDNKLLTILSNQDDVIAMHYGMLFDDILLWHTPAVNVKYLDYSPIELLLFELAKYCKDNHLSMLDYGLGNEKYKERFSNSYREVGSKLIPISYKGKVLNFFTRRIDPKIIERVLHKSFLSTKSNIKKILKLTNKINYYTYNSHACTKEISKEDRQFSLIFVKNFMDLVEIFKKNNMTLKRFHYNRIKSGNVLLCLVKEPDTLLSYGWATDNSVFFVSEINQNICNKGKLMLFDFITPIELRGKGYYTLLLKEICAQFQNEQLAIFAEKKNIPSNKAILRAGFQKTQVEKCLPQDLSQK